MVLGTWMFAIGYCFAARNFVGGLETAHLQVAAAPVEVGVRLEEVDVLGARVLREKAAVTAVQADDTVTVGKESLRDRHDDSVHTRSRAASAEDDDGIFHCTIELIRCFV